MDEHDLVLFDLDGTVYRGSELVPGALEAIRQVKHDRAAVRYVTNNASKPDHEVAGHLRGLGLPAASDEVSTSAQAAAGMLSEALPGGSRVLVVGSPALAAEVEHVGLRPVREYAQQPDAVVQGHSTETAWWNLAEACLAIRGGAAWVASNTDRTLPTERGELPGNGAMVAALQAATGRSPAVAGKPERPLLDRAVASAAASAPLMVGDRLDTDIAGGVRTGIPTLLVLTGVSTAQELLSADTSMRPDHVAADLGALHLPGAESRIQENSAWQVTVEDDRLRLSGSGDPLAALRALCAVWWAAGGGSPVLQPEDADAEQVLEKLNIR
nr:HAD-IIA family hydrolase [Saccharopolyspora sp. HNM0983]